MQRAIVAALLLTFSSAVASARTAPALASVRFIVHALSVTPPHGSARPAHVGDPLFASYGLRTGVGARASIRFADATVLHVNQRTDLVLQSAQVALLRRGEVALVDSPGRHHQIETATALATAIGTLYDVRIERQSGSSSYAPTPAAQTFPPGTTTISVVSGAVRVSNVYGRVTVNAGEWTHVPPGRPPTTPTRHNARGDISWSAGLP